MGRHFVKQGECLSSIAARYGLSGWEKLHNHEANQELKKKRPNPNILAPGDEVVVPDREVQFVSAATGQRHTFQVKLPKVNLRVAIVDRSGKFYEGKRFAVTVDGHEIRGKTNGDGLVAVEVPATATTAQLRVWLGDQDENALPTISRELAIGHMDPIDMISGIQGRLSNLGYRCGISNETPKDLDDPTLVAVRSFRLRNGMPEVEKPKLVAEGTQETSDDDEATGERDGQLDAESNGEEDMDVTEQIEQYVAALMDDEFRTKLLAVHDSGGGAS